MYIWLILVILLVICALVTEWVYTHRARKLLANLPGYRRLPLLGNILYFIGDSRKVYKRLIEISEKAEETRLPFIFWLGPKPFVFLSEPEDVKIATNALSYKPYYYDFANIWLGGGQLTAPSTICTRHVKNTRGIFNSNIVDGFQEVFNSQGRKLVEKLKHEAGGEPFDVLHKYLAIATLETICQTALEASEITEGIVTKEYYSAFTRILELLMQRGINILHHPDFVYRQTSSYKDMIKCVAVLHSISSDVINRRKEYRNKTKITQKRTEKQNENETTFKPYLDVLLEMQSQHPSWSQDHIKAEVDGIIFAGQETVATTIFFMLLVIGSDPNIQENIYNEVKDIFGESIRNVEKGDLCRMQYCEAVVLETLRLFPPGPLVLRDNRCDLKLGSCTIPAGATVAVNVLGAGRSRRQWGQDALEFRPERWLYGNPAQSAAFLAFSYGKGACIGRRYALAFLKTTLAHCVRQLQFTSQAKKLEMKVDLLLKPAAGHLIKVNLRK